MRRRTWEVTLASGETRLVRSYDAERALAYYRDGVSVRPAPRAPRRKRTWDFDLDALQGALDLKAIPTCADDLTLQSPFGQSRTQGWFQPPNIIRVMAENTPQEASESFWHELAHLDQFLRLGHYGWARRYAYERRAYRYERQPFEIEANEWEAMAASYPLVTPR